MVELEGRKDKEIAELKEKISSQEKELENANELLSDTKHRGLHHHCISLPSTGILFFHIHKDFHVFNQKGMNYVNCIHLRKNGLGGESRLVTV